MNILSFKSVDSQNKLQDIDEQVLFLCQDDHNVLRRFVACSMRVGPLGLLLEILVDRKKNNFEEIEVIFRSTLSGSWSHLTEPYWLCLKLSWN